jgi:hypothetical protein
MTQFEGCKLECLGRPIDFDDPNSMWPPMVTENDLISHCQEWGEKFAEKAPARLEAVGGCPMQTLDSINKGTTMNPITAIANSLIRRSLGITSVRTDEIIY